MIRRVKTENGWVRGIEAADPRITAFKGIPFAAPPVGENRWRAPQPCADWEGELDACRFAPISMQDTPGLGTDIYCREWHVDPEIPMGEDCLYLNVWTNAKSADEKLPVLVWYYGGGLQWGYPAEMEFDGERLARRGIVVVTVNYRINIFGFMAHPQITKEQPDAPTNFGSLDQQAGLKWVKRNIAAFGGDPDNITIAGQSAGGGSVMSQMACPANKGLFQKAVVMSAMIRSPYGGHGIGGPITMEEAEQRGVKLFEMMGVSTLEEARKLDAKFVLETYNKFAGDGGFANRFMGAQDNIFNVGDPMKLIVEGNCADVQIMAGCTGGEFPSMIPAKSREEFEQKVKEIFGDKAEEFLAIPEANVCENDMFYAKVNGIDCTVKGILGAVKERGSSKNHYCYKFDPDIPGWDNPGTFHSVDLWFFFETLAKCWRPFVGRHYDLSRQMCNYWANFIKTGDPNGEDADGTPMPKWEPYTNEAPCEMVFTGDGPVADFSKASKFERMATDVVMKGFK